MISRERRGINLWALFVIVVVGLLLGALIEFGAKFKAQPAPDQDAEAIVVLTGGTDRLDEALRLLEDHRGARLLISGVGAETGREDLKRRFPDAGDVFDCCVDLDHLALDTLGNAAETARWARSRDFHALIIVTGAYHMPRSLLLLHQAAPELNLIPHPVWPERLHLEMWWTQWSTIRLVVSEFSKYVVSLVRVRLGESVS